MEPSKPVKPPPPAKKPVGHLAFLQNSRSPTVSPRPNTTASSAPHRQPPALPKKPPAAAKTSLPQKDDVFSSTETCAPDGTGGAPSENSEPDKTEAASATENMALPNKPEDTISVKNVDDSEMAKVTPKPKAKPRPVPKRRVSLDKYRVGDGGVSSQYRKPESPSIAPRVTLSASKSSTLDRCPENNNVIKYESQGVQSSKSCEFISCDIMSVDLTEDGAMSKSASMHTSLVDTDTGHGGRASPVLPAPRTLPKSKSATERLSSPGQRRKASPPVRNISASMSHIISQGLQHQLTNKARPKPPPKPNLKPKPEISNTPSVPAKQPDKASVTTNGDVQSEPPTPNAHKMNRNASYEEACVVNQSEELKLSAQVPAECGDLSGSLNDLLIPEEQTASESPAVPVRVLPDIPPETGLHSHQVGNDNSHTNSDNACDNIVKSDSLRKSSPCEKEDEDGIMRVDSGLRRNHPTFNAPAPPPFSELQKLTAENSKMSQIPSVHEDSKASPPRPARKAPPPPPLPLKRKESSREQSQTTAPSPGKLATSNLPSEPPRLKPRNKNLSSSSFSPSSFKDRDLPPIPSDSCTSSTPVDGNRTDHERNIKYDTLGYLRPNPVIRTEDVYSYADVEALLSKEDLSHDSDKSTDEDPHHRYSLDVTNLASANKGSETSVSGKKSESKHSSRSSLGSLGSHLYELIRGRTNSREKERADSHASSVFYVDDNEEEDIDVEVKVGGGARTPPQVSEGDNKVQSPPVAGAVDDQSLMDEMVPAPVAPPRKRKKDSVVSVLPEIVSCTDDLLDQEVTYDEPTDETNSSEEDTDTESDSDDYIYPDAPPPGLAPPVPLASPTASSAPPLPSSPSTTVTPPPPVPPRNKPQVQGSMQDLMSVSFHSQQSAAASEEDGNEYSEPNEGEDEQGEFENEYSEPQENEYNVPDSPSDTGVMENIYAEADEIRGDNTNSQGNEEVNKGSLEELGEFEEEYADALEVAQMKESSGLDSQDDNESEYGDAEEARHMTQSLDNEHSTVDAADVSSSQDDLDKIIAPGTDYEAAWMTSSPNISPTKKEHDDNWSRDTTDSALSDEDNRAQPFHPAGLKGGLSLSIHSLDASPEFQRRRAHSQGYVLSDRPRSDQTVSSSSSNESGLSCLNKSASREVSMSRLIMPHDITMTSLSLDNESVHSISDDSDGDGVEDLQVDGTTPRAEEKLARKRKKAFYIAQEIMTSERSFVDVLKLLNVDYRQFLAEASQMLGQVVIPEQQFNSIFKYVPQLENLNRELLKDIEKRILEWESNPRICDIFVKVGPFLKLYTSYIRGFENMQASFEDARRKFSEFDRATRDFEASPRCACLQLKHFMLRPIQRIPQYRLLLLDYQKQLSEDSLDYQDTKTALVIVSEVAEHANQSMKFGDDFKKLWEIQNSLIGQFEVIKPGRQFIKQGILQKLSRKEMQPRMFFLLSDVLLYTTPIAAGYKLNNAIPLTGIRVSLPTKEDFKNEFSIISTQRSFTISASTPEERDGWLKTLREVIEDNRKKRSSFEVRKQSLSLAPLDMSLDIKLEPERDFKLGTRAPVWVPDVRVSMCMLCTAEFTVTFRRHHCRACGKVVCGFCSDYRAPLRYLKYKAVRVCSPCFYVLEREIDFVDLEPLESPQTGLQTSPFSRASIKAKFKGLRMGNSFRKSKGKSKFKRPAVLQEIHANSEHVEMSGYLKVWRGHKWKKRWFVLHSKALYTFRASEDAAAIESRVLLGYEVRTFNSWFEGVEPSLVFEIIHKGTDPIIFRTESPASREKWISAMREATMP